MYNVPFVCCRFLLVVSTIDGSVSAVDMRTSGDLLWSVKGDDRPLLSSSITNIQVSLSALLWMATIC